MTNSVTEKQSETLHSYQYSDLEWASLQPACLPRRRNLTSAKQRPRYSCSRPPNGLNELQEERFEFSLIRSHKFNRPGAYSNPGTQVQAQNKDFSAVGQTDQRLVSSAAQITWKPANCEILFKTPTSTDKHRRGQNMLRPENSLVCNTYRLSENDLCCFWMFSGLGDLSLLHKLKRAEANMYTAAKKASINPHKIQHQKRNNWHQPSPTACFIPCSFEACCQPGFCR